ncbi:MAG: helicase HerA-like domain-containing protein [Dialister invisus]
MARCIPPFSSGCCPNSLKHFRVGDLPKPKMVFFFDEAHLLFNGAPKQLLDKIEQVVS